MLSTIGNIFTGFMILVSIAIIILGIVIGNIPTIISGASIAIISGIGLWMALK